MTAMGLDTTVDLIKQRSAALEMLEHRTRQQLTLAAPMVDQMPVLYPKLVHSSDQYFAVKNCRVCNPPPKVFRCPICDFETLERWQMQSHNMGGQSAFCKRRMKAKQKAWANRVGLDG